MLDKLTSILDELQQYKHSKDELLPVYIQERLNKSLETYYKSVINSFNYLRYKDDLKMAKKLNKD